MNLDEYIGIAEKQEKILQFPHFSRNDAWDLGKKLVSLILDNRYILSVSIRLSNGFVIFQYAPEGTVANNENWMTRKFHTVRDLEISSLLNLLRLQKKGQTLEDKGLDPKFYAASGGGFPIRVKGTGVIGGVIASGLPHLQDHDVLVTSISNFLNIADVPRIPLDAGI